MFDPDKGPLGSKQVISPRYFCASHFCKNLDIFKTTQISLKIKVYFRYRHLV